MQVRREVFGRLDQCLWLLEPPVPLSFTFVSHEQRARTTLICLWTPCLKSVLQVNEKVKALLCTSTSLWSRGGAVIVILNLHTSWRMCASRSDRFTHVDRTPDARGMDRASLFSCWCSCSYSVPCLVKLRWKPIRRTVCYRVGSVVWADCIRVLLGRFRSGIEPNSQGLPSISYSRVR
jgi:hypothetical protein